MNWRPGPSTTRIATGVWLRGAAAWARRRSRALEASANRRSLVESLAPGNSFCDLGGMYSIHGDIAFRAERAGATKVLLFDGMRPTAEFDAEHRRSGSAVRYQQGDLHDPEDVAAAGSFDVVWCSGVVYHSHSPYLQLLHLRAMTRKRLMLGTHVIPEVPGIENMCMFYPGTTAASNAAFTRAHGAGADAYPGMTRPFDLTPGLGYGNMWWGLTPSAVRSMLTYCGFRVYQEYRYTPFLMDFIADAVEEPTFVPPLGFSRALGEERLAGFDAAERPRWAEPFETPT